VPLVCFWKVQTVGQWIPLPYHYHLVTAMPDLTFFGSTLAAINWQLRTNVLLHMSWTLNVEESHHLVSNDVPTCNHNSLPMAAISWMLPDEGPLHSMPCPFLSSYLFLFYDLLSMTYSTNSGFSWSKTMGAMCSPMIVFLCRMVACFNVHSPLSALCTVSHSLLLLPCLGLPTGREHLVHCL
jgi:hypothetical protein